MNHKEFYAKKHQHPINKAFHMVGIPMVVTSIVLVVYDLKIAAALFAVGWLCQFIGHAVEGSMPAFLTHPRHFISGVRWHFTKVSTAIRAWRLK